MFHRHSRTRPFGSRVLRMDDNSGALELKKSILKTADYSMAKAKSKGRSKRNEKRQQAALSLLQVQVRDFILEYQAKRGRRPSYKEIMAATGIAYVMKAYRVVRELEKADALSPAIHIARK